MIRTILFDFDGVIIDSGEDIANAVIAMLKRYSRPVLSKEEIIGYVGRGAEMLIRRSFKDCDEKTIMEVLPEYKRYYYDHCLEKTKLHKNVALVLDTLKDKKKALVTNKPERVTEQILKGLGIRKYFDVVVAPESVNRLKPDPEGLLKALELLNEKAETAIMVGDSHTDIEAGKSAGMQTCGVTYGIGDADELRKAMPDYIIDDMIELMRIV